MKVCPDHNIAYESQDCPVCSWVRDAEEKHQVIQDLGDAYNHMRDALAEAQARAMPLPTPGQARYSGYNPFTGTVSVSHYQAVQLGPAMVDAMTPDVAEAFFTRGLENVKLARKALAAMQE